MIFQLKNLDRYSSALLPEECGRCGWWQGHDEGWPSAKAENSWQEAAAEISGSWGKLALADDRLLGMIQFGPAGLFARSSRLPAGPLSEDAVLLACGAVAEEALDAIYRSLLTAVLAELRRHGAQMIEAFCLEEGKRLETCHFFPAAFLRDCGFFPVRSAKGLKLMRLELSGVQPAKATRKPRRSLLERIKTRSAQPAPVAMAGAHPEQKNF